MRAATSTALFRWLAIAMLASLLSACGYHDCPAKDEANKAIAELRQKRGEVETTNLPF